MYIYFFYAITKQELLPSRNSPFLLFMPKNPASTNALALAPGISIAFRATN